MLIMQVRGEVTQGRQGPEKACGAAAPAPRQGLPGQEGQVVHQEARRQVPNAAQQLFPGGGKKDLEPFDMVQDQAGPPRRRRARAATRGSPAMGTLGGRVG